MRLKFLFLISLMLVSLSPLLSQSNAFRFGYPTIGIAVGATNYLGDLDDDLTFKFTRPGVGLYAGYKFHPHISARIMLFQGWISASDKQNRPQPRFDRNLSFRSHVREMSVHLVYDFLATARSFAYRPPVNPYVFGGIGVFSFNPQTQYNGRWVDLQPLGTEGQFLPDPEGKYPEPYKLTQVAIPMGAGIRFTLSRQLDLNLEFGWRKLFTDYLDDVSGLYPDRDLLQAQNPTAADLSDRSNPQLYPDGKPGIRGDSTQDDWYIFSNVTINYIFNWTKCPRF